MSKDYTFPNILYTVTATIFNPDHGLFNLFSTVRVVSKCIK